MKFTPLKFVLLSLGLHVLGFLGMSEHQIFERASASAAGHSGKATSTVYAEIFPQKKIREPDHASDEVKSGKPLIHRSNDPFVKTATTPLLDAGIPEQKHEETQLNSQDYFTAGRLTLLPFPVTNIDLDVAEVKEVAVPGSIRLTILIDADGMVTQIRSTIEDDALHAFSERVTEIFKRARFSPGEVNGMAVKAQLEIEIVSESLQSL